MSIKQRLRSLLERGELDLPLPGSGSTPERHHRLAYFGKEDVALARLVEAHTDAVAILSEGGKSPKPGKVYGVWASESRQHLLALEPTGTVHGSKAFCSGGAVVDRALVTLRTPDHFLVDIDLRKHANRVRVDESEWMVTAFADTRTATVHFDHLPIDAADIVGPAGWYLSRPGFWNGACGPAACWAGGAEGLWDYCLAHPRDDAQDISNIGAIYSLVWSSHAALDQAGREMDSCPHNAVVSQRRALAVRQTIDQACTEILRRFAHVYGPRALAFDQSVSKRYQEVELYIRQSHAERDLEALGRLVLCDSGETSRP